MGKEGTNMGLKQHKDHKPYQFGTNPMEQTVFEKKLCRYEQESIAKHKQDYVKGILGKNWENDHNEKYGVATDPY